MNDGRDFATFLYFLTQIGNKFILLGRNMENIKIKFLVYVIKRLLVIETIDQGGLINQIRFWGNRVISPDVASCCMS